MAADRDPLLDELADAWRAWDPMPADLPDRILVGIAMADLEVEYELLTLHARSDHLLGARASGDDRTLIEFSADGVHVLVRVVESDGGRRVDGWVEPGGLASVVLTQDAVAHPGRVRASSRFEFAHVPAGLSRLDVEIADAGVVRRFRSPHFEI